MKSVLLHITPSWFLSAYHLLLALFGAALYGFPSRKLLVIGVTGTKGKTTVVHLAHRLLEENGKAVASLSSLRFRVKDQEERNELKMTMPGRFKLQRFLRRALKAGCEYVVLEVTSQGISQHRHRFIHFRTAVMTNVAPEHLEAHGGFEPYLRAKLKLFGAVGPDGVAVINRDDPHAERFAAASPAKKIWYGRQGIMWGAKTLTLKDILLRDDGLTFRLGNVQFSSRLIGEFNLSNILAAIAVGLDEGMPLERIAAAIADVPGIPGRIEYVQREPFAVVVDYAHTPDSLRAVYKTLRNPKSQIPNPKQAPNSNDQNSKLICVLGSAGGGRDRWKRPEMGKIAAEYCDEIILTNEDPYDENPGQILLDIESGISNFQIPISKQFPNPNFQFPKPRRVLDRREAIKTAIEMAHPGDTVVITGKGAEPWLMGPKGTKVPWDDREVVREAFHA